MSTFSTSSRQKRLKNPQFFTLLTSKCASRHNGVHFFDTFSTSEAPKVVRDRQFLTLLTSKCASRHNGVHFFDISTSKSGSAPLVFCPFWLGNVLRATTACTFSCLIWPAGSAPRRFSEPTFRPSGATNHWKNTVNRRLSYLFAHLPLLSSDLVSSDSSHLCVSTVHIVGSFTSNTLYELYYELYIYTRYISH